MDDGGTAYRREDGAVLIELRLSSLRQLFNTLDPAPFHEKDLDADAEFYIVDAAREFPVDQKMKLVVHVPKSELQGTFDLQDSIHHHFALRRDEWRRQLSQELYMGRITLLIALAFLFACLMARHFVRSLDHDMLVNVLGEGLLITGWVAMWRPIDILLYEWWPIRKRVRVAAKLAEIPVETRSTEE